MVTTSSAEHAVEVEALIVSRQRSPTARGPSAAPCRISTNPARHTPMTPITHLAAHHTQPRHTWCPLQYLFLRPASCAHPPASCLQLHRPPSVPPAPTHAPALPAPRCLYDACMMSECESTLAGKCNRQPRPSACNDQLQPSARLRNASTQPAAGGSDRQTEKRTA